MSIPFPKSRFNKIFLIVVALILLVVAFFVYLGFQANKMGPEAESKVTSFLQNTSDENFDAAYALTSEGFKKEVAKEDLEFLKKSFNGQYSGFSTQKQTGWSVKKYAGEPTVYTYFGEITYDDGEKGEVNATLVEEEGELRILYLKVNVDIERMKKFQESDDESVLGVSTSE